MVSELDLFELVRRQGVRVVQVHRFCSFKIHCTIKTVYLKNPTKFHSYAFGKQQISFYLNCSTIEALQNRR